MEAGLPATSVNAQEGQQSDSLCIRCLRKKFVCIITLLTMLIFLLNFVTMLLEKDYDKFIISFLDKYEKSIHGNNSLWETILETNLNSTTTL